jgi:Tfp pilus assembly protein PilF
MLFSRLGDYEQAIKNLELAVTEEPNYWKTHYQLAQAYQRVGNEAKAKEFMDSYNRLFSATTSSALEARGLGGKEEEQGESEKPQK